jgi:hypothetical protein
MITGIKFGGLSKPVSKPKPRTAPMPAEYIQSQPQSQQVVKNRKPKTVN